MKYAVIQNGVITNFVEWDGASPWTPPTSATVAPFSGTGDIGWLWNNGTPVNPNPPAAAPPVVPQFIQRSQGIRQLNAIGKLSQALAVLNSATPLQQQLWYSPTWGRNDPDLTGLAKSALGMTDTDIDNFFLAASQITNA